MAFQLSLYSQVADIHMRYSSAYVVNVHLRKISQYLRKELLQKKNILILVVCALNKIKIFQGRLALIKIFNFFKFPGLIYSVNYHQQGTFLQLLPIPPTILLY